MTSPSRTNFYVISAAISNQLSTVRQRRTGPRPHAPWLCRYRRACPMLGSQPYGFYTDRQGSPRTKDRES